ncbi:unnamed protein product [Phyllotreta striolata]|uniref:Visual system homeobox 2 n=1 Tax=Phyllotreta striolata TaxID=444603 RepID=A0A9N9TXI6_PHYSR|nr:unnamed protein product [Phyllotreta striolata]
MAEYGLYGAMVRHSLPLPETILKSAKENDSVAPWLLALRKTSIDKYQKAGTIRRDVVSGMHRKSLEAAEHLKDDGTGSDHEETTSMRTENSDTSAASSLPPSSQQDAKEPPPSQPPPPPPPSGYPDDPEAFRNNSIACLRAKAQAHSAKIMNHNLMMQLQGSPTGCDANANSLQQVGKAETPGIF